MPPNYSNPQKWGMKLSRYDLTESNGLPYVSLARATITSRHKLSLRSSVLDATAFRQEMMRQFIGFFSVLRSTATVEYLGGPLVVLSQYRNATVSSLLDIINLAVRHIVPLRRGSATVSSRSRANRGYAALLITVGPNSRPVVICPAMSVPRPPRCKGPAPERPRIFPTFI